MQDNELVERVARVIAPDVWQAFDERCERKGYSPRERAEEIAYRAENWPRGSTAKSLAAARAIIPVVQKAQRERDATIALSAKLPRERLSCSDDESGTLISLQRQRRHTATAIRNQEPTDG